MPGPVPDRADRARRLPRHTAWALYALLALTCLAWIWVRTAPVPTLVLGVLMAAGGFAIGDLCQYLLRRQVPRRLMKEHATAHATIFTVVGTVFAVLVAFAIVVVWQSYSDTETTVTNEANSLADLDQMSRGFPVEVRRQMHGAIRTYAVVVSAKEWPAMADGHSSEQADAALTALWTTYTEASGQLGNNPLYQESISRLNDVDNDRRQRLMAATDGVPGLMWYLMDAGALITIAVSALFSIRRDWLIRLLVGSLSVTTAFSLFLVAALEGPFHGTITVPPTALQLMLQHMQHLET